MPALIVLALLVGAAFFGWSYLHGSGGVPSDAAVPTGTIGADVLQSRVEGTLVYPEAANVRRVSGPLSGIADQNPLPAGVVPPLMSSSAALTSMPIVATSFSSADSADQVLAWYKGQLQGRGWCAPPLPNLSASIRLYTRQSRELFSIISVPVPASAQGAANATSQLMTLYALFPDASVVPAC